MLGHYTAVLANQFASSPILTPIIDCIEHEVVKEHQYTVFEVKCFLKEIDTNTATMGKLVTELFSSLFSAYQ